MNENLTNNVNSGVQANVGMEFQKHCTLYLFLDKYEELKNERYFIILEHLEDIVFGYLNENELLKKIETFQAKKSTNKWTLIGLVEIIKKIVETSQAILNDSHLKTSDFNQQNYFATNHTIELKTHCQNTTYIETINETNSTVRYIDIDQKLKEKISEGNSMISFSPEDITNLDSLHFKYIDLSRTPKAQLEQLHGKFRNVFRDTIIDHKAALDTFLFHLKEIESVFNQGNIASLKDRSKRIESSEINNILDVLTTKKLAFEFWRQKGELICENLGVSISDINTFKLHFLNSFDEFKDLNECEHRKVYRFIQDNKNIYSNYYSHKDCILAFFNEFNSKKSTTLRDIQLKAVVSAAYLEVKNTL